MTTATETGGPAFPQPNMIDDGELIECGDTGMTLRDCFAVKAMQAQLSAQWEDYYKTPLDKRVSKHWDAIDIAQCAYEIADEMLEARKE